MMKHELYAILKETEFAKGHRSSELLGIFDGEHAGLHAEDEWRRLRMEETEKGTTIIHDSDPFLPHYHYTLYGWDAPLRHKTLPILSSEYYLLEKGDGN